MNTHEPRAGMARAFRETTLSLIGLFQVYEVEPDLAQATADVLGKLFRRHLRHAAAPLRAQRRLPLRRAVRSGHADLPRHARAAAPLRDGCRLPGSVP